MDLNTVRWLVVHFSTLVVQMFTSTACKLLFISGEKCSGETNSSDCIEKQCFIAENLFYQIVSLRSLYLLQGNK